MSVRKIKEGNYLVRFQYKDKYGRANNYNKQGFKTKRDALNHELTIKEQIANGGYLSKEKTLTEVFKEQMKNDSSLADSTKEMREVYFKKHLLNRIGNAQIELIDYQLIQELFNELALIYTKSTNENVLRLLNSTFKYAYNCGYIKRLPYARIVVKGKPSVKKDKLVSVDEFDKLIEYIENCKMSYTLRFQSYRIALYIGFYTGMRIGEVCALDWCDIDLTTNRIDINKSLRVSKDRRKIVKGTKSVESCNSIPLPLPLKEILMHWREINDSQHVIVDNDMTCLAPSLLKGMLLNYSRKANTHISFHMLRHTYSTMLWENEVNPKVAQKLLRHKDISTTMNIYTHLDRANLNDVVDDLFKN